MTASAPPVEVLRALGAFATLERRSATLDGNVPLRVAQACMPFLEGNALGWQVVLDAPLVARRRLGIPTVTLGPELERQAASLAASVPLLVERGLLPRGGAWARRLARGPVWVERGLVRVWTGLLVRPRAGLWLRVAASKNRAIRGLGVREVLVADDEAFTPLVLDFELPPAGARIGGEVASVVALEPSPRARATALLGPAEVEAAARAHARFYDARYFATKRGEVTKKYRRMLRAPAPEPIEGAPRLGVAHLAGAPPRLDVEPLFLDASHTSPRPRPAEPRTIARARFVADVGLRARFDGQDAAVTPDPTDLARGAGEVRAALARTFGEAWLEENRGAVLYLTKYVTPHVRGEPHFFVKPWSFCVTPPGWSSLVEGVSGRGYELLRGVVWTDRFHATPAVFALEGPPVAVERGAPLLDVIPFPRALAEVSGAPELVEREVGLR